MKQKTSNSFLETSFSEVSRAGVSRTAGDLQIAHYRGGELAETHNDQAIWELMYFGHARDQ
jgi:hypothetical protein